jgi:hypothetical protein
MRFAYIDSQGNEVTIPSLDALALRIELGAIVPETELYDAQADRWGPAHSHEIYHTLARDVGGEDFLVPAAPAPESPAEAPPEPPAAAPPPDGSFGLTLAPSEEEAAAAETDDPSETGVDDLHFDFAPSHTVADEPDRELDDDDVGGFDFGSPVPESPVGPDPAGMEDDALELEKPLGFEDSDEDDTDPGFIGGLDLEAPMSDFDPGSPPAWMEQDGPGGFDHDDGPVMDFSPEPDETPRKAAGWGGDPASASEPEREARRDPGATTPAAPRRPVRRRRRSSKPLVFLLLAAVVGAGGWYGWQAWENRPVPPPPRPAVTIPDLPAELEAPMRALAEGALGAMYAEVEGRAFGPDDPEAPSEEWLAGIYLGNASSFDQVQNFWSSIATFADRLRDDEIQAFHNAYVDLAEADFEGETFDLLVARADSGFLATRDARLAVYGRLATLADAALVLHDFLLTHEPDIVYTPARTFAGNPIEEAVPATAQIGAEMWDRVEDITNALDALGTLDRVTRERLSTVLLQRVRDIGIQ